MTAEKSPQKDKSFEKAKIKRDKGLNVSYDKDELETMIPHLMEELSNREKTMKIESIDYKVEEENAINGEKEDKCCGEDLSNPKAIDFLRRCKTKEEAIEILNYLVKREELTQIEYNKFLNKIESESGLAKLIKESGGLKRPGYYMRKYYYNKRKLKNRESFKD